MTRACCSWRSDCSHVIVLQVSFHKDRPVERINAHTLSGGEKSVVTMLFLLTLQQVPCMRPPPPSPASILRACY